MRAPGKHAEFKIKLLGLEVGKYIHYAGMSMLTAPSFCTKMGAYNNKKFIARADGETVLYWRIA